MPFAICWENYNYSVCSQVSQHTVKFTLLLFEDSVKFRINLGKVTENERRDKVMPFAGKIIISKRTADNADHANKFSSCGPEKQQQWRPEFTAGYLEGDRSLNRADATDDHSAVVDPFQQWSAATKLASRPSSSAGPTKSSTCRLPPTQERKVTVYESRNSEITKH